MTDLVLQPTDIIHYENQAKIDAAQVAAKPAPTIVIANAANFGKQHAQIKVLPFTSEHTDKESLPFIEKLAFFPKVLRNATPEQPSVKQEIAAAASVAQFITGFFNPNDGYADEFAEFMDGFNNKPSTGYEDNLMGFFGSRFVPLSSNELSEFNAGVMSNLH